MDQRLPKFFTKWALIFSLIPCLLYSDGYVLHEIHSITSNYQYCHLEDGSIWKINYQNQPNAKIVWDIKDSVWIIPTDQGASFSAIFVNFFWNNAVVATLHKPGNQLFITGLDCDNGIVTLSDESKQWQLNAGFKPNYDNWEVGDSITLAGRQRDYYIINASKKKFAKATKMNANKNPAPTALTI